MSYKLLQFNLGTGTAQGYVLQGQGEHKGTNETISQRDMSNAMAEAEMKIRIEDMDYKPYYRGLLREPATPDERLTRLLAEFLDRRFMLAHGERMAREALLPSISDGDIPSPR